MKTFMYLMMLAVTIGFVSCFEFYEYDQKRDIQVGQLGKRAVELDARGLDDCGKGSFGGIVSCKPSLMLHCS